MRSHTCGELNEKNVGQKVTLVGWINRRRDHGGISFIDLRDRYGITQIKLTADERFIKLENFEKMRNEWVIEIEGTVVKRPLNMINNKLSTGEIEVEVERFEVLNKSKVLPFEINAENAGETNENIRLKYRFLDLRRKPVLALLELKNKYFQYIRNYFNKLGFIEIQTPILANSSPEGARDFLIPSRLYKGKFYALPQAPQQFKQLLMVGGIDKYFQIAPCFRDEDPRMDRHYGEFYQLDMELSFVSQEDIFHIMEPLMLQLTKKFSAKKVIGLTPNKSFKQISWYDAMTKYGSDKPDLRFGLEITPVTEFVKNCNFRLFTEAVSSGGVVHAIKISRGAELTRKQIDVISEISLKKTSKGLSFIRLLADGQVNSPILKYLGEDLVNKLLRELSVNPGDIVFFCAGDWRSVCLSLGAVREKCAELFNLKDPNKASWCWIVDFPMYTYSELEPGKIDFGHNPFSMPQGGLKALINSDPLEILAFQFDLILNGFEISSGAIRNHDPEIMYKAFEIAGYSKEQVDSKFGGLVNAFEYGAPPHGGNAPGLDRLLMVLQNLDSIRDIYAFPKDGQGRDLMMNSPSEVSNKQLDELHINLK